MHSRITFVLILALALLLAGTGHSTAAPAAQAELPPAPVVNDEGGPKRLTGSLDYTDFSIRIIMQNPAPALIDMVHVVQGDTTQFAPVDSQILGRMTAPVFPPPLRYAFDLPAEPTATLLDVDNDGETDTGVQIFKLIVSANLNGLSHLEQLDQAGDTASYLTDPTTGAITAGSLLVYAPDDQQGFPSGYGDDGVLFTADDPAVALPQGYTVVRFGPDGFTFDRAAEATLDLLANPEAASPDFSDQGIVESFNSLIDHLALRYSFTELRQLDWEAIRAQYLPQVEEAEQLFATNPAAAGGLYGHLLHLMAQQVRDAHVLAVFQNPAYSRQLAAARALKEQPIQSNLGATTVELSNGRIVIADVLTGSPAAEAGWTIGTEIVAVDGVPVADYLPTVVYNENVGTDEGQRLAQVNNLLKFPGASGTEPVAAVTIDAILPGAIAAQSFTLTPGRYVLPDRLASLVTRDMPIQYKLAPGFGYLTWGGFTDPEMIMAGLRQFLSEVKALPTPLNGVILDLRGNGGGWDLLYFTMASYFFDAEQPVSMHWIDLDSFNPDVGELVREAPQEYLLSAPDPDLYYGGPLVVLVDQHCASSCEFFTQFLQTNKRATVVAMHASAGAGAPINRVAMPFGITFQYTKGRSYFAGTEELNLEGKGVVPDVRVPVTPGSVTELLVGGDPVLAAGVQQVNHLAGEAFVASLVLTPTTADVAPGFTAVYPTGWQPTGSGTLVGFIAPDQRSLLSYDTPAAADLAAVLAPLGITDPAAAPVATRTANGTEWAIYASPDTPAFAFRVAVAQIDGKWHVIRIGTSVDIIENAVAGLLYPAIDAYVPGATAAAPPTAELTQLRATPWQWVAFANPAEQFRVETPLDYLIQFNDDATVNVVADCNNAVGAYQGEGGSLQIELGPMTAAACPPDSRSDQFVRLLSGAALYYFQDGNLYIDLFADGGTMVFSPAPPDIFGDDGGGAVAGLPATLVAALGNLSYRGLFEDRAVTLASGFYSETSDAETIAVQLLEPFIALGDLNGDGTQDAVALLELNPGGSGRFIYLAPVLDVLTTPVVGSAIMVEDRIQPTALTVADGQVIFEYIGHGEGDGECCPSWNIRHTFAWQDGALVEVSRAEVSKAEAETAATATGATAMDAISDEDFALFQQVAQAASERVMTRIQEVCPEAITGRTFPLAEPDYNAKRPLDLSAFADALAGFDPARAEAIAALLAGKAIPEIQALLDSGELTSVELVTWYVDRIQRYDVDRLNSVIELNPQALADAAAADAARAEGRVLGGLHGIPVLLKDNIATGGGLHTTAGAYALKEWQPERDAFLVQQLRAAGAIILGKNNLSEWANYNDPCMPSGFSAVGGQTRNPHGPHEVFGSSSGSAASVAADLTTVAVGSETSGSMIQPARVNGVVGLRPSQGLISRDYVVPLGPHLDTPGPMGRSVTDVAILLNALKGVDANDLKTADAAALADVDFTDYLSLDEARKVRVGVILPTQQVAGIVANIKAAAEADGRSAPTDEEVQAVLAAMIFPQLGGDPAGALDALKAQGIEVVAIDDSSLPWPDMDTAQPQLPYDFKAGVAALFSQVENPPITSLDDVIAINDEDPANRAPYGQNFLEWSVADTLTAEEFARVQTTAAALAESWMNTILEQNNVDILVTGMKYAGNAGAAGVPALTIPNGLDANGRPQGIILSGPYLSDPQLIAVGYALEQALNGRVAPDLEATIAEIDAVTGK